MAWHFAGRSRPRCLAPLLASPLLLLAFAAPLRAQEANVANARQDAPLVYLDCGRCDDAHVRREITFVNYVRDPNLAQVHVLVTSQTTGSGGRMYTLVFSGRPPFSGVDNTLQFASLQSNSAAQERDGLAEVLKLGLVPYAARTPLAAQLRLSFLDDAGRDESPIEDRWHAWTFEIYGGGNFENESTQSAWNARYGFYANRVTDHWKIRLRPYFNNNVRSITTSNAEEIRIDQKRHGVESFVVRSLGDHVGVGIFADYITSTIDNLHNAFTVTPAIEYSLYPYSQSTHRQITLTYRVGYELADYLAETIYEKTEDALLASSLDFTVQVRQPWGSISSSLAASSYLHAVNYHRLTYDGNVSLRLGRGISLNVGGNYQRINDQLALPRGDASLEDILLQRRRLATSYRSSGSISLSYTFGSIYSSVVNPRL